MNFRSNSLIKSLPLEKNTLSFFKWLFFALPVKIAIFTKCQEKI